MTTLNDSFKAEFYDGNSARAYNVTVHFTDIGIKISGRGFGRAREWAFDDIRQIRDEAGPACASFRVKDGLGRLNIPTLEQATVLQDHCAHLKQSDIPKSAMMRIAGWGLGAVASVILIMFVIIPALSNTLATMIPVEREVALGRQSLKQIERFVGGRKKGDLICKSEPGQAALEKMTARLAAHANSPYPVSVRVFDTQMPNAFAVPGGHIVLFNGLIKDAKSPEEVAGVLGHEMGHVVHRDPTRLTLRSAGSVGILGMVFGDFAGGTAALVIAERLIAADYSQDAESDADGFAHDLMADAGLPSAPLADFFESLIAEFGESNGLLSHIASHPDLSARAAQARAADVIGEAAFEPVLTASEWQDLRQICGKDDPEDGSSEADE